MDSPTFRTTHSGDYARTLQADLPDGSHVSFVQPLNRDTREPGSWIKMTFPELDKRNVFAQMAADTPYDYEELMEILAMSAGQLRSLLQTNWEEVRVGVALSGYPTQKAGQATKVSSGLPETVISLHSAREISDQNEADHEVVCQLQKRIESALRKYLGMTDDSSPSKENGSSSISHSRTVPTRTTYEELVS